MALQRQILKGAAVTVKPSSIGTVHSYASLLCVLYSCNPQTLRIGKGLTHTALSEPYFQYSNAAPNIFLERLFQFP